MIRQHEARQVLVEDAHTQIDSKRLIRYFAGITRVEYLDHPLKFSLPSLRPPVLNGPLLWIGRRCNIGPVREWWNHCRVSGELWVLTDNVAPDLASESLGFRNPSRVRVCAWSPEMHLQWTSLCLAAIDVKADDFRSRHKPPAKAFDFVSSGVPVISNYGSSVDLHLQHYGIRPLDIMNWNIQLTQQYQTGLHNCATTMRHELTPANIWRRFSELLNGPGNSC